MENLKQITRVSDIPYCGSLMIEGYYSEDFKSIKSYCGTTNPDRDYANPNYFIAEWADGEYREVGGNFD